LLSQTEDKEGDKKALGSKHFFCKLGFRGSASGSCLNAWGMCLGFNAILAGGLRHHLLNLSISCSGLFLHAIIFQNFCVADSRNAQLIIG
jgi:hypothetical protein